MCLDALLNVLLGLPCPGSPAQWSPLSQHRCFEAALGRLGLPPARCLVVGDTPYDAEAARKAGLAAVGVLCGGFPEKDIRDGGATAIFADPADLLRRYDDWTAAFGG